MSMIEKIGRFIIEYQFEVEVALCLLVALIAMVLIIKTMRNAKEKRRLISQINDTVSEINATVNDLETKKPDVIYIDNRACKGEAKMEFFAEDGDKPTTGTPQVEPVEPNEPATTTVPTGAEGEHINAQVKYFQRDCAQDKHGKIHTIEELKEQIKE